MTAAPWWQPWAVPLTMLVVATILGLGAWLAKRTMARIDDSYDGVYSHKGPVATVRQELTTISERLKGFMTREEFEAVMVEQRTYFDNIQKEASAREGRILDAISEHSKRSQDETKVIRDDLRNLTKRIDHVYDK